MWTIQWAAQSEQAWGKEVGEAKKGFCKIVNADTIGQEAKLMNVNSWKARQENGENEGIGIRKLNKVM